MNKLIFIFILLLITFYTFGDVCKSNRSRKIRYAFLKTHPCPATGKNSGPCPGYVVDHIIPLHCCGKDEVSNMQWQTVEDAKKKDILERDCNNFLIEKKIREDYLE